MKIGDLVRLRKSHRLAKRNGWFRQWAEAGTLFLLLGRPVFIHHTGPRKGEVTIFNTRWDLMAPDGELVNFEEEMITTWGIK